MEQHNTNMSVAENSTNSFAVSQQSSAVLTEGELTMAPPLRYAGGNLGLSVGERDPVIHIVDATGKRFETHSIEWLLQNIEHFQPGRNQVQPLACAAIHYGLDAYDLMGADSSPKYNVVDDSGNVLLADASHISACIFADEYAEGRDFGAAGEFTLSIQRASRGAGDERHEGPLALLHHNLGVTDFEGIAVKSHAGRCGMMLEEVLWRIDQFNEADQAELLAALTKHFDLGEKAGAA